MAGNSNLPRLATRGIVEPTGKVKREPKRYATAERKVELTGPAVETIRSFGALNHFDLSHLSVPARAVLFASASPVATCRFPFGEDDLFTFCGARATVKAAGVLTYCADCAKRMGFDLQAWQRSQDATRKLFGGMP